MGGGLGGIAGALAALRLGKKIVLTEETDWIGGQLTAQAVPPDEHPWIEGTGCTGRINDYGVVSATTIAAIIRLLPEARFDTHLNPGQGRVSPLCHEPRVALAVLYELLAPYLASGQAEIVLALRASRMSKRRVTGSGLSRT